MARAEELAELAGGMIAQDRELDVVGGAASLIGALLSLHRRNDKLVGGNRS